MSLFTKKTNSKKDSDENNSTEIKTKAVCFDLNEINVPQEYKNVINTGWDYFNSFFFLNGVKSNFTTLVSALPGTGKTMFLLSLAQKLVLAGHVCLYNSSEQHKYDLKLQIQDLNIGPGIFVSNIESLDDLLTLAKQKKAEYPDRQFVLFCDSIQSIQDESQQDEDEKERVKKLNVFAKENNCVVFIVSMVGKNGEYLGSNVMEHIVDAHIKLGKCKDKKSEFYGKFCFWFSKNRFGYIEVEHPYKIISKKGFVFLLDSMFDNAKTTEERFISFGNKNEVEQNYGNKNNNRTIVDCGSDTIDSFINFINENSTHRIKP